MSLNNLFRFLPIFLVIDLIIPFLLAPTYKGYSHLTQVMSVLGNLKAPLHLIYNIWLVAFGLFTVFSAIQLYTAITKVSGTIAILLLSVLLIYAIGGCILSGVFSVGETKSLDTLSEKIHGYGSVIGFLFLAFAPLLIGLYFFKICFISTIVFFVLFVMADKPQYQGTLISLEGLWQRLTLLNMYLPIVMLCVLRQ